MATMGKYCKAYLLKNLRQFKHWTEQGENARKEKQIIDDQKTEIERNLADDDIVYLQENYVVTDGIFQDEHIIFEQITPEWKEFCITNLKFEIPNYDADSVEVTSS